MRPTALRPPCRSATGCTRTTRPVRACRTVRAPTRRLVLEEHAPMSSTDRPPTRPAAEAPLSPAALLGITRELATRPRAWRSLAQHTPRRALVHAGRRPRRPRRLADRVGLVQGVDLHDHGGAARRALRRRGRVAGDVDAPWWPCHLTSSTCSPAPRARSAPATCTAWSTRRPPATSLHVYSPPLEAMDFYVRAWPAPLEHAHRAASAPRSGPGELR